MHPELQRIETQYLSLVDEMQAGHVGEQDALRVLAGLTAVDGAGTVWSIDPYTGEFVASLQGAPPVPADPSTFVPAQLPPVAVRIPAHGSNPEQASEFLHPALHPVPPTPLGERAASALGSGLSTGAKVAAPAAGFLRRHLRTVLVVAGVMIVLAVLVARSPESGDPDSSTRTQDVSESTAPPPVIIIPGAPDAGELTATTTVPATPSTVPDVPDDQALAALLAVVANGDPGALALVLPADDDARLALIGALGAARAGFQLSWGDVVKGRNSSTVATLRIGDPQDPLRVIKLRLVYQESRWVLTGTAK